MIGEKSSQADTLFYQRSFQKRFLLRLVRFTTRYIFIYIY